MVFNGNVYISAICNTGFGMTEMGPDGKVKKIATLDFKGTVNLAIDNDPLSNGLSNGDFAFVIQVLVTPGLTLGPDDSPLSFPFDTLLSGYKVELNFLFYWYGSSRNVALYPSRFKVMISLTKQASNDFSMFFSSLSNKKTMALIKKIINFMFEIKATAFTDFYIDDKFFGVYFGLKGSITVLPIVKGLIPAIKGSFGFFLTMPYDGEEEVSLGIRVNDQLVCVGAYFNDPYPVSTCPAGYEKDGPGLTLCYPKCRAGYQGIGPVCWEVCKSGFTNGGGICYNNILTGYGKGGCCVRR